MSRAFADTLREGSDFFMKVATLPRELGEQLDPSVRGEYYRIWDAAQEGYDPSAD